MFRLYGQDCNYVIVWIVIIMAGIIPKIALLGRPNVGKSTLFNRLIRSNRAITHDRPGVTRDRMEGIVRMGGVGRFVLIDTGGVTLEGSGKVAQGPVGIRGFEGAILLQAKDAVKESSLICLVVDARDGLTPFDQHLADFLRKSGKPSLLVVNKVDGEEKMELFTAEFHQLGMEMLACSASHGFNMRVLEKKLVSMVANVDSVDSELINEPDLSFLFAAERGRGKGKKREKEVNSSVLAAESLHENHESKEEKKELDDLLPDYNFGPMRIALLGRPNAGKSSLVNALVNDARMIVSDVAGTTRDSVDVTTEIDGEPCTFVDTAGVRRRARITDIVERYSVNSSIKSTTKAHVTLLVLDACEGVSLQDKRLIELLAERKTPFMVLVNKCDLVKGSERKEFEKSFKEALSFCVHVPILYVSAVKKINLKKIVPQAKAIRQECGLRISTGQLNRAMEDVLSRHQPPIVKRARAKFFYLTQAEIAPPTFVFFVNNADKVLDSYARYLERSLRKIFGIIHAPMRVHFRSSHKKKR